MRIFCPATVRPYFSSLLPRIAEVPPVTAGMVFCCRMCRGSRTPARLLLAHGPATRSLRPPWSGVSTSVRHTTPVTCVEEVARPWTVRPGNRAPRVSRFGDLATKLNSGPIGMAHPGNPVGAT